jgi:hypothetical protein
MKKQSEKINYSTLRKKLIVQQLKSPRTANEAISRIFANDLKKGANYVLERRGWKFYVHLNKFFAPLEREGKIKLVSVKGGEKLWVAI